MRAGDKEESGMGTTEIGRGERSGYRLGRGVGAALLATGLLALLAFLPATAGATVIYPPSTGTAVKTAEGFELKGTVYNYGGTTTWHFEYGTTTAYGTVAPVPDTDAGSALASPVSQLITGLAPDTTYHYRLVSDNSEEGIGDGADRTFSTATTTTPPPTGTGTGETPPATKPGTNPGATGGSTGSPGSTGSAGSTEPTVGGSGPKRVAKAVAAKGQSLLATTKGRTLYSLSAEKRGKFICTASSGCTSIWVPLTVASGVVPMGPVKLGTIRRPEGTIQVTYQGHPLYTFASDKKPGQTKGEGIKDVGTWHATLLPAHQEVTK
jgi:predicted lipoprotein with Yx(FWY)xxD motif